MICPLATELVNISTDWLVFSLFGSIFFIFTDMYLVFVNSEFGTGACTPTLGKARLVNLGGQHPLSKFLGCWPLPQIITQNMCKCIEYPHPEHKKWKHESCAVETPSASLKHRYPSPLQAAKCRPSSRPSLPPLRGVIQKKWKLFITFAIRRRWI